MEILPGLDIESRLNALAAEQETPHGELGRDAFLKLLTEQLANQDPLEPMNDHEFVAQLAQFSSVEQLENINAGIQTSLLMNQSVNNSLATNLIGKEIYSAGNSVKLGETGSSQFRVELATDANVTVNIIDSGGVTVRTLDLGELSGGMNNAEWDGLTGSGDRLPEGEYTVEVEATDLSGNNVATSTQVASRVDGVRFLDGTGYLLVNGEEIPLASVIEVLAPSS